MNSKYYKGSLYAQALRSFTWFEKAPEKMTPIEIVEWALSCGQWTLTEAKDGSLAWVGPWGSPPFAGSERATFRNRDVALKCMQAQYSTWHEQRNLVESAFMALHRESHAPTKTEEEDE